MVKKRNYEFTEQRSELKKYLNMEVKVRGFVSNETNPTKDSQRKYTNRDDQALFILTDVVLSETGERFDHVWVNLSKKNQGKDVYTFITSVGSSFVEFTAFVNSYRTVVKKKGSRFAIEKFGFTGIKESRKISTEEMQKVSSDETLLFNLQMHYHTKSSSFSKLLPVYKEIMNENPELVIQPTQNEMDIKKELKTAPSTYLEMLFYLKKVSAMMIKKGTEKVEKSDAIIPALVFLTRFNEKFSWMDIEKTSIENWRNNFSDINKEIESEIEFLNTTESIAETKETNGMNKNNFNGAILPEKKNFKTLEESKKENTRLINKTVNVTDHGIEVHYDLKKVLPENVNTLVKNLSFNHPDINIGRNSYNSANIYSEKLFPDMQKNYISTRVARIRNEVKNLILEKNEVSGMVVIPRYNAYDNQTKLYEFFKEFIEDGIIDFDNLYYIPYDWAQGHIKEMEENKVVLNEKDAYRPFEKMAIDLITEDDTQNEEKEIKQPKNSLPEKSPEAPKFTIQTKNNEPVINTSNNNLAMVNNRVEGREKMENQTNNVKTIMSNNFNMSLKELEVFRRMLSTNLNNISLPTADILELIKNNKEIIEDNITVVAAKKILKILEDLESN